MSFFGDFYADPVVLLAMARRRVTFTSNIKLQIRFTVWCLTVSDFGLSNDQLDEERVMIRRVLTNQLESACHGSVTVSTDIVSEAVKNMNE